MNIFIPVIFICANSMCEFQQATSYFYRMEECMTAVETQRALIVNSAAILGYTVEAQATCVTARITSI